MELTVSDLAFAIATAEGFGIAGAIPTRAHNPGDLVLGDKGFGVEGAEGITRFENDATGWTALEHQLQLIRERKSHVYTPSMTIQAMASKWTRTDPKAWATNVCEWFHRRGRIVTPQSKLSEVL